MKAAVFKGLKEKIKVIEDYPKPVPDKDEILIKVKFCGICGIMYLAIFINYVMFQ